jgi:uncharacterized SAM-binding protein YcdF (DUF218 family)
MGSLIHNIFDPFVLLLTLMAACLITHALRKNRLSRFFLWLAGTWFFMISISPVPQWLIHRLEHTYPVIDIAEVQKDTNVHLLVLGGGHAHAYNLPYIDNLSDPARARLSEAIRLYRQLPGSMIVCSGYSSSGRTTQAEMLALAALELGVAPADTLMVPAPANSAEEARDYALRFGNQHRVILVTSAFHMRRAVKYFRREGLDPVPAPTDHYIKKDPLSTTYDFWPSAAKIHMMGLVLHEYAGLVKLALTSE